MNAIDIRPGDFLRKQIIKFANHPQDWTPAEWEEFTVLEIIGEQIRIAIGGKEDYMEMKLAEPILLTPEHLKILGFEERPTGWVNGPVFLTKIKNSDKFIFFYGPVAESQGRPYSEHGRELLVQYVHKVQNLFYELTGRECI